MSFAPRTTTRRRTSSRFACVAARHRVTPLQHSRLLPFRLAAHAPACSRFPRTQSLRQKAAFRNPDEFYFAMEKARTRDGVHVGRRALPEAHVARGPPCAALHGVLPTPVLGFSVTGERSRTSTRQSSCA